MKIRYTVRLECECAEDALRLPVTHQQFRELVDTLVANKALPAADVSFLLIPGVFK